MSGPTGIALADLTATQLGGLISGGVLDPLDVTERTLAAIDACDDKAIFIAVTRERAMAEAKASAERQKNHLSLGLLDGVPVAWKDLFDMKGVVTTAASKTLAKDPPAKDDATVVARLKAAGMIAVGRVNMTEFAYSGIGLNPHFGTPHNPHGKDAPRIPGGSSSGSGVVVARKLVPISIGSDTGGSVRLPAAFNGIVGYKSTTGRYPMDGVYPLSTTLDSVGVFCRSVADAALVDAAMRAAPLPMLRPIPPSALHVFVPTNVVFDGCEPAVYENFEAAIGRLQAAGAKIERGVMPEFDQILKLNATYGAIVAAEAYALHRERVEGPAAELMDQRVVTRIRMASKITMTDYARILQARRRLIDQVAARLGDHTIVACPTVPHTAPKIADLEADRELFSQVNGKTLRNTMLGNNLDWCGVTLPNGTDPLGLPTAFLLSAGPNRDDFVLAAALGCEHIVRSVTVEGKRH